MAWIATQRPWRWLCENTRHPEPIWDQWWKDWLQQRLPDQSPASQPCKISAQAILAAWTTHWKQLPAIYAGNYWNLPPPGRPVLKLFQKLQKAQCSLLVQIWTGKIGLAKFLYQQGVPGVTTPMCDCGWSEQTARHITVHCRQFQEARIELQDQCGVVNFSKLMGNAQGVYQLTRWWLQQRILPQFHLADNLFQITAEKFSR